MKLCSFLKDKCLLLILHFVCMAILSVFLRMTGYSNTNILLIIIVWLILLITWLIVTFLRRKHYFSRISQTLTALDQKYLLGEMLPDSFLLEDKLYREILRRSNKAVIERIRGMEKEQADYREYIENWVHEIKAPITGIALLCENGKNTKDPRAFHDLTRAICLENEKTENFVDLALYYARSENVYKDFLIQKTDLQAAAEEVLEKNKLLLIGNQVRAQADCRDMVYTDRKWISFILNQIILNSVKYRSLSPFFSIYTSRQKNGVLLTVEDNGTGIRPEELPRIFEKGFTGSNGRGHKRSTGIGLYLCQKLCTKLGIGISAESEYGTGTRIMLFFPVNHYVIHD